MIPAVSKSLSVKEIHTLIRACMTTTVLALVRTGEALAELESRGENTDCYTGPFFQWARDVHAKRVDPTIALKFAASQPLYRALKTFTLEDQEQFKAGTVEIWNFNTNTAEKRDLAGLSQTEMRVVFPAPGVLATPEEQRAQQKTAPITTPNTGVPIAIRIPKSLADLMTRKCNHHKWSVGNYVTALLEQDLT